MTDIFAVAPVEVMSVDFALSSDASRTADAAVEGALEFCAQKTELGSPKVALGRLRQGDRDARGYFEYGLARAVAEHLGALDDEVQAAYLFDDEPTPHDAIFGEAMPSLIHLLIRVRRKTGALNSLITALDRALVECYARLLDTPQLMHLIDVQVVDDAEVKACSGYGAMFKWLHHRPLRVWAR